MKIGIFGGSFNPVHFGHIGIAKRAIETLELDRLIVVPAAVSPFKTENRADEFFARLDAIKAAFEPIEKASVDMREIERGGVSYAIDTIREIAAEYKNAEIFFIIGEDSLEGLPRWKDIDAIKKLCSFKVYPRTKESSSVIRERFDAAKVTENPNAEIVRVIREGLKRKGWHCPCEIMKTAANFCPCDNFLAQLVDDNYHGFCHCRLYFKP